MPALHERRERLAQRRARDVERHAQLALGGQALARGEQAELDGGADALQRLLEGRLRPDRREQLQGAVRGHSRSKPRTRSQSVTAASKASSSTWA